MFSFPRPERPIEPTLHSSLIPSTSPSYGTISTPQLEEAPPEPSTATQNPQNVPENLEPVTWRSLPCKTQLIILALARLSEPLAQTSLQAYMFHQLRFFDPSLPESTISTQAGILQGCFTGAQFFTSVIWGRYADSASGGRRRVLLIGLAGTAISCIGFGFAENFATAAAMRSVGGALNGNVAVINTMVNELVDKRFHSRAFLIIPLCFNIGVIVGPVLGGLLADPVEAFPSWFGKDSLFGGHDAVWWMKRWPYAFPNIVNAIFLSLSFLLAFLALRETHEGLKSRRDWGLEVTARLKAFFRKISMRKPGKQYDQMFDSETEFLSQGSETRRRSQAQCTEARLDHFSSKKIWTSNVVITLLAHAALAFHYGTFNNLWFVFLSASRSTPSHPFQFNGGLGLSPSRVGLAMAVIGVLGIITQLTVYPLLSARLGTIVIYRLSLLIFPLVYILVPYLVFIPKSASHGTLIWIGIVAILIFQVLARTFSYPATMILVNNCSPHPSILATVHGMAQSVVSATRTLGPVLFSWIFGVGLQKGVVGLGWWVLAGSAIIGLAIGWMVRDGTKI